MALWSSSDAAEATGGTPHGKAWTANGVSIDTRTLKPGDLFVALKDIRDGHEFVADALAKGAAAALVSYVPDGLASDAPLLVVDDVLVGLECLGRAARARTDARVIGVTGSAGKTSTKEMLLAMLSVKMKRKSRKRSLRSRCHLRKAMATVLPWIRCLDWRRSC